MILDSPGSKRRINRPIETVEDEELLGEDDSIVSEIIDIFEGIEALDDDCLEAIAEVISDDIGVGSMNTDLPISICTYDGKSAGSPLPGQLQPSSQSFEEIAEEGETLLSESEYYDRLKKLVEELEGIF